MVQVSHRSHRCVMRRRPLCRRAVQLSRAPDCLTAETQCHSAENCPICCYPSAFYSARRTPVCSVDRRPPGADCAAATDRHRGCRARRRPPAAPQLFCCRKILKSASLTFFRHFPWGIRKILRSLILIILDISRISRSLTR